MKTLVVLSALASVTFAAPPFTDFRKSDVWSDTIKRDKKSPQGYFFAESAPVHFAGPQIHMNSEIDGPLSSSSARTFGFKKPVFRPTIIKNHNGYHLYRDSEEERAQADPLEDCSKQVKVKLCEARNKEAKALTRSVKDDSKVKEDNIESRIKLAKEAIEDLQKEMKNQDQGLSPKSAGWKQREVESDAEFQQDIEVARKALDHIHRNFGNLEPMSLHAEPSHQVHDETVKQNDMQRTTQWKENIESIKRQNVDVGRNMEDILHSADQQSGLSSVPLDTTQFMRKSEKEEVKFHESPAKVSNERTVSNELNKDKHIIDDMNVAATSLDSKIQKTEQNQAEIQNLKSRNGELASIKAAEHHENNDKKSLEPQESPNENLNNVGISKMKAADNLEKMKADEHFQKITDEGSHLKKTWPEAKSSEHPAGTLEKKSGHMEEKITANIETPLKSAEPEKELKNTHEEQTPGNEKQTTQQLKSVENIEIPNMRWSSVNTGNMENKPHLKAAEEFHKEHLKGMQMHTVHHGDAAAAASNHMDATHGHGAHGHRSHAHSIKIHEHPMHHPKSADMDGFLQPNLQMNLGDISEKSAMENAMQRTHKQDGGRAAYGPYGAGGSGSYGGGQGAVGVFPSAHVGGCAVPLLLSCSPSVVSGSLAKSGYGHAPSYGPAPAYKAAEETTHNKRDVKKVNEISNEKLTHKNLKMKKTITAKKI